MRLLLALSPMYSLTLLLHLGEYHGQCQPQWSLFHSVLFLASPDLITLSYSRPLPSCQFNGPSGDASQPGR